MKKICDLFYDKTDEESKNKIEFGLSQAEKGLKSTTEISDKIEDKAYKLIGFFITSFILTTGVLFTVFFNHKLHTHRPSILVALLIFVIGLWCAIQKTKKTFAIEDYFFVGNLPENFLNDKCKDVSSYQLKILEIENYNKYISHNRSKNNQKAVLLKEAYNMINTIVYASISVFIGIELILKIADYFCVLF